MKKAPMIPNKQKCSCCGRSQARVRWQGFRLCPSCRIDITRDITLKNTMLGLEEGFGGKHPARVRYLSCPSCQRRVTKQYAFVCTQCDTRICIYCTAPDSESLCMPCSDKLVGAGTLAAEGVGAYAAMPPRPLSHRYAKRKSNA